ncbi:LysR family transcriptional regulator for bpeEF and oprC [Paraburkholderia bannensis]|uniref:LysR family transcriptional regulator for bpeEF and oprC n=1 Tax=Paraburkholderia bannensis TaxID=765414 RepID=A0A7W9WUS3_9BURK|nr:MULTISPECIES: LysR family transcriptional regulator [Paraburkholderia]MBB3259083.1 LysR family transcriptional regulator for bpeEF and oprC [Paraburkholderia sp. WP4_3_2]MBB6104098.1 LysR family transcriptional regulator for bpeEF and oprC [Paraburkholderia bannensis]
MDRIQAMQVFTRIVDFSSFARAATSLGMNRPTVTTMIQSLEDHLGTRLLNRTTRSLSLTTDGAAYYEHCLRILAEVEDTEAAFQKVEKRPRGKLRIGMQGAVARQIILPRLRDFHGQFPEIDLQLGLTDRHTDVLEKEADCAVHVGDLNHSALVSRRIGVFDCMTVASPSYLEKQGVPRTLDDLKTHRGINYFSTRSGRILNWTFMVGGREMQVAVKGTISVNEAESYVMCGLKGLGLMQAPRFMILPQLKAGQLIEVLPEWKPLPLPISIVYPQSRHLSPKVRAFVDWVVTTFADCPLMCGVTSLNRTCPDRTFEKIEHWQAPNMNLVDDSLVEAIRAPGLLLD